MFAIDFVTNSFLLPRYHGSGMTLWASIPKTNFKRGFNLL